MDFVIGNLQIENQVEFSLQLITKHSDLKWDKTIKKFYIILKNIYHQNNEISLHQKKKEISKSKTLKTKQKKN